MKRVIDLARITLACVGFVVFEPWVQSWVEWPLVLEQALAIVLSSLLAWLVFEVANPMTFVTVEWSDIERKVTLEGDVFDLAPKAGVQARTYRLKVGRSTPAWVGRRVLRSLANRDLRILVDSNQDELLMDIQSLGVERYATYERDGIAMRFGKDSHSATAARADLALDWSETTDDAMRAVVRYRALADGRWGWWLRLLVVVQPSKITIRKIPTSV